MMKADVMFFLESNPARDVPKPQKTVGIRDRDLNWDELKIVATMHVDP